MALESRLYYHGYHEADLRPCIRIIYAIHWLSHDAAHILIFAHAP